MAWLTNSRILFPTVILLGVLVNRGLRLKEMMTTYENMTFNDQNCVLKGSFSGAEDMALGKNSVLFFGSSGGLSNCFANGSAATENGGFWMLDMKASDPEPVQLDILDFPHESIHVHGIYVSNKTDRLYFINHIGPISTVEVLKIEYTPKVVLKHLKTVKSDLFPRYGINDLVEGIDENEIYVSRWQVFSMRENGQRNLETAWEKFEALLGLGVMLFGPTLTLVYRCDLVKNECYAASDKLFVGANGMTVSPDRQTYFVADPMEKKIGLLKRQSDGWLEFQEWIQLPFGIDNIEFEPSTGEILLGTIPDFHSARKQHEDKNHPVPGGLSVLYLEDGQWKTRDILMHDGLKLAQISAGSRFGNTVVLGSPHSKGLLVCKQQ
eukprot:TRINITY_DN995_c0_g1_i3.p1 TRINITY_DN995_c0_g1~~TRINITY_DN995_c0_g1_i3.p1  ORF type:complete len:380 (-),score=72.39 TRINITY_DN995_c0_g1_i3:620-1759(-)